MHLKKSSSTINLFKIFFYLGVLRPGIIYFIFPNGIRNGIINFCSEFLDERLLVRDVEHTSVIGEIIIF